VRPGKLGRIKLGSKYIREDQETSGYIVKGKGFKFRRHTPYSYGAPSLTAFQK